MPALPSRHHPGMHADLDAVDHVGGAKRAASERAIADGKVRRDLEPPLLDVDEEFTPALRALADPGLEADEFLFAFGCGADQHQHAFGIVFHPGLQVDPVRPNIHVLPC
jgi:hypothetical protein